MMRIHYEQGPVGVSTIEDVVDSKGDPVPRDTATQDPVLTLSGSGTRNSVVFIFDNGDLLTPASVIDPGGTELHRNGHVGTPCVYCAGFSGGSGFAAVGGYRRRCCGPADN